MSCLYLGHCAVPSSEIFAHFPNTDPRTREKKGVKTDSLDFKVVIAGKEFSFEEFTGSAQKNDKSKMDITFTVFQDSGNLN
ncbi:hypothetical protein BGX26_011017 [Mortierella sp. AD094]|nr:hypothetical protein BGX26_011017 [Mortierella sp. AD094]